MNRKGQIINTSKSHGLGVCEMWSNLFEENEKNFKANRPKKILTDEQITKIMLKAFPDRKTSQILYLVNKVRGRFNRGELSHGKIPRPQSCRYIKNGIGKLARIKSRKKGGSS